MCSDVCRGEHLNKQMFIFNFTNRTDYHKKIHFFFT